MTSASQRQINGEKNSILR